MGKIDQKKRKFTFFLVNIILVHHGCPKKTLSPYSQVSSQVYQSLRTRIMENYIHVGLLLTQMRGQMRERSVEKLLECFGEHKVYVPPNLTEIVPYAFQNCTSLVEIVLPPNLTEIGAYAFKGCTSLRKITLPPNLTEIGYGAFP